MSVPPVIVARGAMSINKFTRWASKAVADGFAKGHRGISLPDPVVASAEIDRAAIFAVFVDRMESELILDPAALRRIAFE